MLFLSNSAIICHECIHKDTGDRIACEDPNSAEVQTICSGAVSPTPDLNPNPLINQVTLNILR